MQYRVTKEMKVTIGELHALRAQVDERLASASGAAREEWSTFRGRIPPLADLDGAFVELSEGTLLEMKTKISRFSAILRDLGATPAAFEAGRKNLKRTARRPS